MVFDMNSIEGFAVIILIIGLFFMQFIYESCQILAPNGVNVTFMMICATIFTLFVSGFLFGFENNN